MIWWKRKSTFSTCLADSIREIHNRVKLEATLVNSLDLESI